MIDNTYDFRKDVKPNADPDKDSKKLRSYHKKLWSKNLPSGEKFNLSDTEPNKYLFHKSSLGEFEFSSDSITHSYIGVKRMNSITKLLSKSDREEILQTFYTIGGFIINLTKRIPLYGEIIKYQNYRFKILSHSRKKIIKLNISKINN